MITKPVQSAETGTMNNLELTSINALMAYTADNKKVSEDLVREVISTRFGVDCVKNLPRDSYDDVIRFLVDIQVDIARLTNA